MIIDCVDVIFTCHFDPIFFAKSHPIPISSVRARKKLLVFVVSVRIAAEFIATTAESRGGDRSCVLLQIFTIAVDGESEAGPEVT